MKVKEALAQGRVTLNAHGVDDAGLEAEVLLRHTTGLNRVQLYTQLDRELTSGENGTFRQSVRRRTGGEPAAYITGNREFYGLDFHVDSRVLIPRPESESLIETAIVLAADHPIHVIADIGTGSGAVAVTLATQFPAAEIYAIDISPEALKVAGENCRKHGVSGRVRLLQGDLLAPLPEPVDLIVANLPYVREGDLSTVNTRGYEPAIALDGGNDGLDVIRRLIGQLKGKLKPGGVLLMEVGAGQGNTVTELLADVFPRSELKLISDFAGIDRVISFVLP